MKFDFQGSLPRPASAAAGTRAVWRGRTATFDPPLVSALDSKVDTFTSVPVPIVRTCTYSSSTGTHRLVSQKLTSVIMRFASITAAFALLLAGVSALEKPLDIEVTHPVECSRKTKKGE